MKGTALYLPHPEIVSVGGFLFLSVYTRHLDTLLRIWYDSESTVFYRDFCFGGPILQSKEGII